MSFLASLSPVPRPAGLHTFFSQKFRNATWDPRACLHAKSLRVVCVLRLQRNSGAGATPGITCIVIPDNRVGSQARRPYANKERVIPTQMRKEWIETRSVYQEPRHERKM